VKKEQKASVGVNCRKRRQKVADVKIQDSEEERGEKRLNIGFDR